MAKSYQLKSGAKTNTVLKNNRLVGEELVAVLILPNSNLGFRIRFLLYFSVLFPDNVFLDPLDIPLYSQSVYTAAKLLSAAHFAGSKSYVIQFSHLKL